MGIETREKVAPIGEMREVEYDEERWKILRELRDKARKIGNTIPFQAYINGSVARGDVSEKSDVDLVILDVVPSYMIEANVNYLSRKIVQATPNSAIKAVYEIDERANLIFPLVPMRDREIEFYDFGGKIPVSSDDRVRGVNKKLLMIEPTARGHREWSIITREAEAAKLLGISLETVMERVRVLRRRDRIGRTGVYLKVEVPERYGIEEYLRILADRDPVIRRRVRE